MRCGVAVPSRGRATPSSSEWKRTKLTARTARVRGTRARHPRSVSTRGNAATDFAAASRWFIRCVSHATSRRSPRVASIARSPPAGGLRRHVSGAVEARRRRALARARRVPSMRPWRASGPPARCSGARRRRRPSSGSDALALGAGEPDGRGPQARDEPVQSPRGRLETHLSGAASTVRCEASEANVVAWGVLEVVARTA